LDFFYRKFQFLLEPKNYQISVEKQKMLIQWNKFDSSKIQSILSSLQALWNKLNDVNREFQKHNM
jgi:hypothetical protein